MQNFNFSGDYKKKMKIIVSDIEASAWDTTREERLAAVEEVTNEYIEQVGEKPDPSILCRLEDVILHEELTDQRSNKMKVEEYPILSDVQYGRRTDGKRKEKRVNGVVDVEVPMKYGMNVATDGRNYTLPIRSFKNTSK